MKYRGRLVRCALVCAALVLTFAFATGCTEAGPSPAPSPQLATIPASTVKTAPFPPVSQPGGTTLMLTRPAISAQRLAFVYGGDLWVAATDGTNPRRLTVDGTVDCSDSGPVFSPDGSLIAFSRSISGNTDIYTIPAEGGEARRITWHPATDLVQEFSADGSSILFASNRDAVFGTAVYTHYRLFTTPVTGETVPEPLDVPYGYRGTTSSTGVLAYNPFNDAFRIWKDYRGGLTSTIQLWDHANLSQVSVPKPEGGCNDISPMWLDGRLYFLSDRSGEFNLFSYDPNSKKTTRLTQYADFPVLTASAGAGRIVLEQAGTLHMFDPASGSIADLNIGIQTELAGVRPKTVAGADHLVSASPAPGGSSVAMEIRGDIVVMSADGSWRNLTQSSGVAERNPAWSADASRLAYFTDASGEYELCVRDVATGATKNYTLNGSGFYSRLAWAPLGDRLAFADQENTVYWLDLVSGRLNVVARDPLSQRREAWHAWSPDGRLLAYTKRGENGLAILVAHDVEKNASIPLTDGMCDVSSPAFDSTGHYLYFLSSNDAGPSQFALAMSSDEASPTMRLRVAPISTTDPSPLAQTSPAEVAGALEAAEGQEKPDGVRSDSAGQYGPSLVADGFQGRVECVQLPPAGRFSLAVTPDGNAVFVEQRQPAAVDGTPSQVLVVCSPASGSETVLAEGVELVSMASDGSSAFVRRMDGSSGLINLVDAGSATASTPIASAWVDLPLGDVNITVEPKAEWQQMYQEAWRLNRDYYYRPDMFGLDWESERDKYARFLPAVTSDRDMNRLLAWFLSEMRVGHHFIFAKAEPATEQIGLLGADYAVENGAYRFTKVYSNLSWFAPATAPLCVPGSTVTAGEYLLAVNGRAVTAADSLFAAFVGTAGKDTQLTVGPDAAGNGARTITVRPLASDYSLRYWDWVERNRRYVAQATDGKVGYVHLPNTADLAHAIFKQYFFAQSDRQAMIIDDRFNGGGQFADYVLNLLSQPTIAWVESRASQPNSCPNPYRGTAQVMIVNEVAGSGGDMMPWGFRKLGLGKLVGERTWGGLVGIDTYPLLLNGTFMTVPNLAVYDEAGWATENLGVPPDIEVEQSPALVAKGLDPQLEAAIQSALSTLAAQGPASAPLPPSTPPTPFLSRN